ncbi:Late embryogenesis abundant protein [Spatholobus suberectus]|nr:Late embryogenesis abundant protein [Spatholobus suberectus]
MKVGSGKGRKVCLTVTGVVIAIVLLIVILALTVFKAKHPVTTVESVKLEDFHVGLDIAKLKVDLNVTLDVDVSVKNPNKVGFKYSDSTAHLNYRGQLIGEVPVPAGEISSGETKGFNLTVTIMADRLLSDSQLYSDVTSGTLPLNTFVKISGKVSILGSIKVHVVSSTSCDFAINISTRAVGNQECQYKTKL